MTTRLLVDDFLAQKRIAFVGVSHFAKDFTRRLFREFQQRGYEAIPVNPQATEIEGIPCFRSVSQIRPPVDGALLLTNPAVTDSVVEECAEAGVRRVWMYRADGAGAVSDQAVKFCESRGIRVIPGECPFMFLPGAGLVHRMHGFVRKIRGCYPN